MFVGASRCLFLCETECVFTKPAKLVAGGREISACAEKSGKEWVGGVGAEEEGVWETGHLLLGRIVVSGGEVRRGLALELELRRSGENTCTSRN